MQLEDISAHGHRSHKGSEMKKIRTALREDFGQLDRDLVRSELLSQEGVLTVSLEPSRNGLTIEYDPAHINDTKLIEIMCLYGVYPEPVSTSGRAPATDG